MSRQFPPLRESPQLRHGHHLRKGQLLPVSGIFWLSRDLTKPALHGCPPKRQQQPVCRRVGRGPTHSPREHPHNRLSFAGVSVVFDSGEENRARGGWSVEIPSKNNVTCDHIVSCLDTGTRPVLSGLDHNTFSNIRVFDLCIMWPTI